MSWRVGIDIGGTFTDFVLQKEDGSLVIEKTLSTPSDRSEAVMAGLEKIAAREGLEIRTFVAKLDAIVHGTTVADNTLIEMNGAVTGLLTTAGFRDELELRRGFKEDIWDVRLAPPPAIAPRRRRLTVTERIRFDGTVHTPLDEAEARKAIRRLARQGVESVAISLLFSFVNPDHEKRLAEWVSEELPDAAISVSHEVLPRAPEFERTSTTVVNAYVGPKVSSYLDRLKERLASVGYEHELLVMQSNGGVMTRDYLRASPVRVLSSGPAAGVVGGAHIGRAKGASDLLCVDMGGTSYDVSVVIDGRATADPGFNWHHRYMVATPMVKVETLGAGGGSIAHLNGGRLQVGPASAGADPGPICYGQGGTHPTVTDANLVLGLLSDEADFAGGSFRLTRKGVDEAFEEHVCKGLDATVEEAAFDVWRIVNANMTQAVRRTTAERGMDPRDLSMLAYGGNGPVFAGIQAQELGIERVLVPKTSPAFSALGALAAMPIIDEERAYLVPTRLARPDRLQGLWHELDVRAEAFFGAAGFDRSTLEARYKLNLRYPGQNWSLSIDVATVRGARDLSFVTATLPEEMIERFHTRHEDEYGHRRELEEPEITGVRLVISAPIAAPAFASGLSARPRAAVPTTTRRANLGEGFAATPIYRGPDLAPGDFVESPGIIEETFTTIVVYPGWTCRVDDAGDYQLERRR